jgi:amino acid transporter
LAVRRWRWLLGFIHRIAYAVLVSFVVWFLWTARFDTLSLGRDFQLGIVKVLDFPVAMVSERMPLTGWRSIDPFTRDQMGHNEPNEKVLLWHLRLAVPVYVVLFYLPNLFIWIVRRFRNRSREDAAVAKRVVEHS